MKNVLLLDAGVKLCAKLAHYQQSMEMSFERVGNSETG